MILYLNMLKNKEKIKLKKYLNEIIIFLKNYLKKNKLNGFVLGLSGGIDSALTLFLLLKTINKENIHILILPCETSEIDFKSAINLCKKNNLDYKLIDLTSSYHTLIKDININELQQNTKNNIKSRLRMITLYTIAQEQKSLVVGTCNLNERYVGYFTKFGDGACDIMPLAMLNKKEIYEAAKILHVSDEIIKRFPSAGFNNNQKDEDEIQVPYEEFNKFLLGKKINKKYEQRIKYLHKINKHKNIPIPKPKPYHKKKIKK